MHNSLPLEIAKELKQEADYILFTLKINNILQKLGKVIIGGSYALNLLAWRDLDIYLVPHNKQDFDLQLLELGKAFLKYDETILIKLERHLHKRIIHCPAGHYLQVKFLLNNLLSWKIDIWIIDDETLTKNIEHLHAVTAKLTAECVLI